MTPAARVAASVDILDEILTGRPAEQVLTHWARANRYAGSGDRAAIRDHVYDVLRCRRSFGWRGGAETGRGLMIGALRAVGIKPETLFTGEGFAPKILTDDEATQNALDDAPEAVHLDCPDWLLPLFAESLAELTAPVLTTLQTRAPVFLRVNLRKTSLTEAVSELAIAGIVTKPHPLSATALQVTDNPRRVQMSPAYTEGRVEVQDVASQAVMDLVPLRSDLKVLDYCAGGGGKSLALAGREDLQITAYDVNPQRMKDLPNRAERAEVQVVLAEDKSQLIRSGYDLVLCDAPCSGSGAWRRSPEAKWTLTPERLADLTGIQAGILDDAVGFVAPGGVLVYATCSLLTVENRQQIDGFLAHHPDWSLMRDTVLTPLDGGDGFYLALLTRA